MSRNIALFLAVLAGTLLASSNLAQAGRPDLGTNTNFHGWRFYTDNNAWNKDITAEPVDLYSDSILLGLSAIQLHPDFGTGNGIPYTIVSGNQRKVKVTVPGAGESDPGMFPIPPGAPIEGGGDGLHGDSHVLVFDRDNYVLYETFSTERINGGQSFQAAGSAMFNVKTNVLRPKYWSSCDAAGLPILPGLVRGDEVFDNGVINHAIRCTVVTTRHAFVPPATHWASSNTSVALAPMGCKFRLKATYPISYLPTQARVVATCLQKYGMILADNGGDLYISGSPDSRYNGSLLNTLTQISGADFEIVQMVGLVKTGG